MLEKASNLIGAPTLPDSVKHRCPMLAAICFKGKPETLPDVYTPRPLRRALNVAAHLQMKISVYAKLCKRWGVAVYELDYSLPESGKAMDDGKADSGACRHWLKGRELLRTQRACRWLRIQSEGLDPPTHPIGFFDRLRGGRSGPPRAFSLP